MSEYIQLVEKIGFPILLSLFLLIRFEKTINNLSENIKELKCLIEKHMKKK